VSFYKFYEGWMFEPGAISIDDFADRYAQRATSRSYWGHLLSWWRVRHDPSVLLLSYEQMTAEPAAAIRRVAAFCGIPLDDALLALAVERSSIGYMLTHKDQFSECLIRGVSEARANLPPGSDSAKVRQGGVGGHAAILSPAAAARLDAPLARGGHAGHRLRRLRGPGGGARRARLFSGGTFPAPQAFALWSVPSAGRAGGPMPKARKIAAKRPPWPPANDPGIDPAERAAHLIATRNLKMARSAHAYVRGATVRFYDWLEQSGGRVPEGPAVWICGDCHMGNLGPWPTPRAGWRSRSATWTRPSSAIPPMT
jgi:hypothetical protein